MTLFLHCYELTVISNFFFTLQANVKGLTGLLELQQGRRLSYTLDIMELKETGLYKVLVQPIHRFTPRKKCIVML